MKVVSAVVVPMMQTTLSIVREVPFPGTSVLRIRWHAKVR